MSIERAIASITEDRRADYLFSTRIASDAVGCHERKFSDWWTRTRGKLVALGAAQPGKLAAELAGIIALAIAERERRDRAPPTPPLRIRNH